ncbi:hypothetical protein, partial [Streptomyces natalensis]|uniref:hypothetical protein n=1 Tax=Streptomyces natalensis TaxID=68242 RepID=UPI0019D6B9F1
PAPCWSGVDLRAFAFSAFPTLADPLLAVSLSDYGSAELLSGGWFFAPFGVAATLATFLCGS